jgi:hypothetical protein
MLNRAVSAMVERCGAMTGATGRCARWPGLWSCRHLWFEWWCSRLAAPFGTGGVNPFEPPRRRRISPRAGARRVGGEIRRSRAGAAQVSVDSPQRRTGERDQRRGLTPTGLGRSGWAGADGKSGEGLRIRWSLANLGNSSARGYASRHCAASVVSVSG